MVESGLGMTEEEMVVAAVGESGDDECWLWLWLTNQLDIDVSINGYNIFHKDRLDRKGGVVCADVCDDIECNIDSLRKNDSIGIFWLQCILNTDCYSISVCYHPSKPSYPIHIYPC